jgi:hypothetical protein
MNKPSALTDWTPEQIALGKKWVEAWRLAGHDLERIRRNEIRQLDTYKTIFLLCGSADYTQPPYAPRPWSGWDYIREQLQPLAELKDAPEIMDQLEARRIEFEQ